jgi:hypothetical protein
VARPLPRVIQPVQCPPQGVVRQPPVRGDFEELLEQGHRPADVRVAQVLGRNGEEGLQQVLLVLVQRRGAPPPRLVAERRRVVVLGVSPDPVVNALPRYAEHAGQVGDRPAVVELQDGKRAPEDPGVPGLRELPPETLSLPRGKAKPAHGLLPTAEVAHERMACQINSAALLRMRS